MTQVVERIALRDVVVGVDGSDPARAALQWAAEYASCMGRPLHVVRAWTMTSAPRPKDWSPGYVPSLAEYEASCRDAVEPWVASLLPSREGLDVHVHTVHAPPSQALVESTVNAELLVVGWRGRGGLRDMLLGSTAEQVVRQAQCAVTVVRPTPARPV